ncbi:MAG: hypothetical protein HY749_12520 [Gammaproteobacteria bacterium]|nr:hypothetical protein [Gammaproteobacteria bacterium]MBI5616103.1 hypothetical protein [Gammaproteobacteria bacterium]
MSSFQSIDVVDVRNARGTREPCRGIGYPNTRSEDFERVLEVNHLTAGLRRVAFRGRSPDNRRRAADPAGPPRAVPEF